VRRRKAFLLNRPRSRPIAISRGQSHSSSGSSPVRRHFIHLQWPPDREPPGGGLLKQILEHATCHDAWLKHHLASQDGSDRSVIALLIAIYHPCATMAIWT
jgi:hypothetical protein